MKITRQRLREIIKEELEASLNEYTKEEVRAIMRGEAPPAPTATAPPPTASACDPDDEEIDISILSAAIEALEGSEIAHHLDCFKKQLHRAFEGDDESPPRPPLGAPIQQGIVGFEEE